MLNPDQVDRIRGLLIHPGWTEVVRPILIERGKNMIKMLMQPNAERPGEYKNINDDVMRGQYKEIEWILSVWDNEIKVYEHNRNLENGSRADA